uniref:Uncharacterized protein ORF15 n=1 Tax=Alternaria alternata TaxID=5599 RepID=C9K7F8_ALTAL|nr:hypothetical protein [Alternaria alternata]
MPKSERRVRFCQLHIYASETVAEEKTMLEEKTVHRVSSHGVVLIRYSYLPLPLSLSTQRPPYEVAKLVVVQHTQNTDRERFLLSGQLSRNQFYSIPQMNPTRLSQLFAAK